MAKSYNAPRLADTAKMEARENALNLLKKPPVPKQKGKEIQSFLYGKGNENDNLQTLKEDLRKNTQTIANLQKAKFGQPLPKASLAKQP